MAFHDKAFAQKSVELGHDNWKSARSLIVVDFTLSTRLLLAAQTTSSIQ
jgi:hypothetical protein